MKTINYYLLVLVGLSSISWLVWYRFIHERMIRDIPNSLFTEIRFWTLLYICCIYLYMLKNLVLPKENNKFSAWIISQIYYPMELLDEFIKYNKYNKYTQNYFVNNILTIIAVFCSWKEEQLLWYI